MSLGYVTVIHGNKMCNFVMKQVDYKRRNEIFYDVLMRKKRNALMKAVPFSTVRISSSCHPHMF